MLLSKAFVAFATITSVLAAPRKDRARTITRRSTTSPYYARTQATTLTKRQVAQSCPTGTAFDSSAMICRDVTSDTQNCGTLGRICPFVNGINSCTAGACAIVCNADYLNIGGNCIRANLSGDSQNCGAVGARCDPGLACVSGTCSNQCPPGFGLDVNQQICRGITADKLNCGRVGLTCPRLFGIPTCVDATCVLTCYPGFVLVNGRCQGSSNVNNAGDCGPRNPDGSPVRCTGTTPNCVNSLCSAECLTQFGQEADVNGTCRDITSDTQNCGGTRTATQNFQCNERNGVSSCVNSQCDIVCNSGFIRRADITCQIVDTISDSNNCGSVGNVCPTGTPRCVGSVCSPRCGAGTVFDANANICRDSTSSTANCGGLEPCPSDNGIARCMASVCSIECFTGFQNVGGRCVGIIAGCGMSTEPCPAGFTCTAPTADGRCVDLQTDRTNCGMVGTVCPGTTACVSGVCGSTVSDNNNCGLNPTVVCPAGQTCISSVCTPVAEPACGTTGAPCGTGFTCTTTGLDGQCVNLATDRTNCGMVGTVCPGTTACVSGVCGSTVSDNNNCGLNPTVVCPAGQTCISSVCTPAAEPACGSTGAPCAAGLTCTSTGITGTCVNLATDRTNCGMVGTVCPGTTACVSGVCGSTVSDNNNCGLNPTVVCPAGQTCISSVCTPAAEPACGSTGAPCAAGLTCTSTGITGTCVNLATDRTNCGMVGTVCPGTTTTCVSGICTVAAPGPSQRAVRRNRKLPYWF